MKRRQLQISYYVKYKPIEDLIAHKIQTFTRNITEKEIEVCVELCYLFEMYLYLTQYIKYMLQNFIFCRYFHLVWQFK